MKFKHYFFTGTFLLTAIIYGCDSKKSANIQETTKSEAGVTEMSESAPLPVCGSMEGDTINMHGKFVLFFGPAAINEGIPAASAGILEFQTASSKILDSLKTEPGIFSVYTSANYIRVYNKLNGKPMIIMRNSFKEPTGMVISDGLQAPVIKKGVVTEIEYRALINQYFIRQSS